MSLTYAYVTLLPSGYDDRVFLVLATDAIRLSREGTHERAPAHLAAVSMDGLAKRDIPALREFVARTRLAGIQVASLRDDELLARVRRGVRNQELTILCESDEDLVPEGSSSAEQRRLVRDIERKTRKRLAYSGRNYKLVADVDYPKLADRDSYEVVKYDEAARILDGIAKQGGEPGLSDLLAKAKGKLTHNWRPPLMPDGLVLLRRSITPAVVTPSSAPAMTPSQMAQLLKPKTWIELEVVYEDGTPYEGPNVVTYPGGGAHEKSLDGQGCWGLHEIDEGTYKFAIPPANGEGATADGDEPEDEAKTATRVRLVGMLFDANKCFLLPQALPGIKTIIEMHEEDTGAEVLIVGHAGGDEDLAGADIALDRAQILGAYLKSQPNMWLNWFGPDKSPRSRWGTREVQLMLSALPEGGTPFYEGYASGVTDEKTTAAIKAFQEQNGLDASGKADFDTRKALVEAYMGISDTTLEDDVTPVAHGCEGHFDDTPLASGAAPDDRRLEVFFFKDGIDPKPADTISSAGSTDYSEWLSKVIETRDFEHHGIHVQIIDCQKQPAPFATVHLRGPVSADAEADEHGFVSFFGLTPGEYTLSSEKNGYKIGVSKLTYPTAKTVKGYASTTDAKAA